MRRRLILIVIPILLPSLVFGMFVIGERVPVERLIANVQAHFSEYKNQAEAHYLLGRLESLSFSDKSQDVEVFKTGGKGELPQIRQLFRHDESTDSSRTLSADAKKLFYSSVQHYREAIALDPSTPVYYFSLGWMADQGERFSPQLSIIDLKSAGSVLPPTWRLWAIQHYRDALRLAEPATEAIGPGPAVALQAGDALVADLEIEIRARPDSGSKKELANEIEIVKKKIARLNRLPHWITPLVFSTRANAHLADLLSACSVRFDLDGLGEDRDWPWLQSDTAILVWDPSREGHIESGRQLFGSVTWWMFWRNGFQPLAALDNNGDGWLTGAELDGISVWQDHNGNGVSEPGEVKTAQEFGITAISVRAAGNIDGVLANRAGIRFRDNRTVTLFDWEPQGALGVGFLNRAGRD